MPLSKFFLTLTGLILSTTACTAPEPSSLSPRDSPGLLNSPGSLSDEPSYQTVLKTFTAVYAPILQQRNLELEIQLDEENPDYFGGASLTKNLFTIVLGKELSRVPRMTPAAVAFALCHEIGHVLGEEPKKTTPTGTPLWSSAEGQSDYYAARVCLPKLFATESLFQKNAESAIIRAGEDWIAVIFDLVRFSGMKEPSALTPDQSISPKTILSYPTLQCRLDTIIAGARQGPRPPCWYRD